ncbi:M23 family metallopeptidase [Neobacillus terrae]|uniref:M23 family metallopeptidase n=1 Tax=Neobacillus terrae TaxID=3034837 RepID=UPI00140AE019|nr:peptidoglycan DD-metalloendopeptidase family protein [Neobacillus terrae]NHM29083.1 peptidoglycan DD-metalloendopeptidase family protein [Neobacillus terrae]
MREYIVRFLIAGIMMLLVSLLFLGVRHPQASMLDDNNTSLEWKWPADGVITDKFGTRHGEHKGIDIAGTAGTKIYSVDDGVVEKSYLSDTYGNVIFVKHPSNFVTVYAHLSKRLVMEGQQLKRGALIGLMGSTGESTGVHLHFEVHETEWTFDKKHALNPEMVLGLAHVGETVHAGSIKNSEGAMEALSRYEENEVEQKANGDQKNIQTVSSYTVLNGDTLWSIAKKNHSDADLIKKMNNMTEDKILPGQVLKIQQESGNQYIVRKGDTLISISKETHLAIEKIKELNRLSSDVIFPNQVLVLGSIQK